VTFVRTVLGDIDPSDLDVPYSHEHLIIDGGPVVAVSPDFLLADVDRMTDDGKQDGWRRKSEPRRGGTGRLGGPVPGPARRIACTSQWVDMA
jgi:hypothetical protein